MGQTKQMTLKTPVLLIVFNRPDTTRQIFEAVRKAQPPRLYIAADGPRKGVKADVEKCATVRSIFNEIDWDCKVSKLFHEENLNCGRAPSAAFNWFFDHEEEGIILEDDCLPSQSFFLFCQELLERYRHDTRVMHIGGNNFLNGWQRDTYSYYFSRSGHIWGWATWRRAWKQFDFDIKLYNKVKKRNYFEHFFLNILEKIYRLSKFDKTISTAGPVDWWDYQWDFARYVHSGLSIVPHKNLVRNLGFGESGTHTRNRNSKMARLEAHELNFPLSHPPFMIRDVESDRKYFSGFIKDVMISKLGF